jgi:hypothetical protein
LATKINLPEGGRPIGLLRQTAVPSTGDPKKSLPAQGETAEGIAAANQAENRVGIRLQIVVILPAIDKDGRSIDADQTGKARNAVI